MATRVTATAYDNGGVSDQRKQCVVDEKKTRKKLRSAG